MRKPALNGSVAVAAAITVALYLPSAAAWAQDIVIKKVDRGNILLVDEVTSADGTAEVGIEQVEVPLKSQSWIGVKLEPLSDVVRAQLDLPAEAGVVVGLVFLDSPAAEAGIEQYDIIIRSGDHPIRAGAEMVELVKKTKDGKLPLTIFRKGKSLELTVTPAERPGLTVYAPGIDNDGDRSNSFRYNIVGPGVLFQKRLHEEHRLPEGMRIRIVREVGQPDRVTIDRGDDHWELTDKDQIKQLPDDIRPHVERHLGQPLGAHGFAFGAPVERGLRWLQSKQRDNEESDDVPHRENDEILWQELEPGGPLPPEFNLDRAMDQIESLRKQFEQLADEQSERTEGLIEEKGEELEETLNDRVTRLEEMLTQRADQLREMIQSFFGDREEVEIDVNDNDENKDAADNDGEEVKEETDEEAEAELEIELDLDLDSNNTGDAV